MKCAMCSVEEKPITVKHMVLFVLTDEVKATGHMQRWENLVNITPALSLKYGILAKRRLPCGISDTKLQSS